MNAVASSPEEQLAWEARQRPKAGFAAIAAALLTIGAAVWTVAVFSEPPLGGLIPALERAAEPGGVGSAPSLRTPYFEHLEDRTIHSFGLSVVRGLAFVGLGITLLLLAVATRARRPELPRFAPTLAVVGSVLPAIASVLAAFGSQALVAEFLDGPRTVQALNDLEGSAVLGAAQLIGVPPTPGIGTLILALAFVLICLHAMRAGLLTRFLGILGIIVGVLLVFPIGTPIPVVQIVWLLAVGLTLLGRVRNVPPAWSTGRAEPWPSQLERRMGAAAPAPEPAAEAGAATTSAPSPATSRKKRKKRR